MIHVNAIRTFHPSTPKLNRTQKGLRVIKDLVKRLPPLKTNLSITIAATLIFTLVTPILGLAPKAEASGTVGTGVCQSTVGNAANVTVTQVGNDCLITFNASTTWTVPAGIGSAAVLVVGGGGGGGADGGSGGGGGELRHNSAQTITPGASVTITIGAGGAGGAWSSGISPPAANGSASSLSGAGMSFTAQGGRLGGGWTSTTGGAGGTGGTGGTGQNGGAGGGGPGNCSPSGALRFGQVGSDGPTSSIPSTPVNFGGGGGGGLGAQMNNQGSSATGSAGGAGGGGRGASYKTAGNGATSGVSGLSNSGGGGGGGSACDAHGPMNQGFDGVTQRTAGGAGGSGVAVIRYLAPPTITAVSISGTATIGSELRVASATTTGTLSSITHQWQSSANGSTDQYPELADGRD